MLLLNSLEVTPACVVHLVKRLLLLEVLCLSVGVVIHVLVHFVHACVAHV